MKIVWGSKIDMQKPLCFYCECKTSPFRKLSCIALLALDALYLLELPQNDADDRQKFPGKPDPDIFKHAANLLTFSSWNTRDYQSKIIYDRQAPDWTPLDEVEKTCVLSFKDNTGRKWSIRSCHTDDVGGIRALADAVFLAG